MTTLALDSNHDLLIKNNSFQVISGEEEVRQKIITVLKTFRGECFLDTTKGIPYLTDVIGKQSNLNLIASLIKDEIIGLDIVESLDAFSLEVENRVLILKIKVNSNININLEV